MGQSESDTTGSEAIFAQQRKSNFDGQNCRLDRNNCKQYEFSKFE